MKTKKVNDMRQREILADKIVNLLFRDEDFLIQQCVEASREAMSSERKKKKLVKLLKDIERLSAGQGYGKGQILENVFYFFFDQSLYILHGKEFVEYEEYITDSRSLKIQQGKALSAATIIRKLPGTPSSELNKLQLRVHDLINGHFAKTKENLDKRKQEAEELFADNDLFLTERLVAFANLFEKIGCKRRWSVLSDLLKFSYPYEEVSRDTIRMRYNRHK